MNLKDSLNLYEMNGDLLPESRMKSVLAGYRLCGCACYFSETGGSGIDANGEANYHGGDDGLWSPYPIKWYRDEDMAIPTVFIV